MKITLLLIAIMIMSMSVAFAADEDVSSDLAMAQDDLDTLEIDSGVDDVSQASGDVEILAAGTSKNFTVLQNEIDTATGSIFLTSDYIRADGENDVSITQSINIIGSNNPKIDANNLGGIFNVQSGCSLTLVGVTLINGNSENGGAIYNDGGSVSIVNSKLLDNTATKSGGAIYNNAGTLLVSGSTLDGNDLTDRSVNGYGGAAIYDNGGTVIITNSNITNNLKNIVHRGGTGTYEGDLSSAAVTSQSGTLSVSNSYFANNSGSYGGAILSNGNQAILTVSGSKFENNFAFNGGAIDFVGKKYTISNSTFKNNMARGTGSAQNNYAEGGAISAMETTSDCSIINCTFENNSAADGGAISSQNTTIIGCTFNDNTANSAYAETFNGKTNKRGGHGGAIDLDNGASSLNCAITIQDSEFNDNGGTGNYYGVYLRNANSEITGSSFTNTMIEFSNKGSGVLSDNTYDNENLGTSEKYDIRSSSSIPLTIGEGQVPLVKSGKSYVNPNNFTRLQELVNNLSGSIYLTGDVTKLDSEYETFANGISVDRSISIYGEGHTITSDNGKVFNVDSTGSLSVYNANVVGDGTPAIVNDGTFTVGLTTTFANVGEYAIENNGRVSQSSLTTFTQLDNLVGLVNGGEVYIGSSKITKADDEKEAFSDGIVIDKDLIITGYANNKRVISTYLDADNDGRIFNVADGATLTLNSIILKNANADEGAAVYVNEGAVLNADIVDFTDNTATTKGGAIYSEGNVNLNNAVIKGNKITKKDANDNNGGAAIYNKGTLALNDTKVIDNQADYAQGDILDGVLVAMGTTNINNSYFYNNHGRYGGAITLTKTDDTLTVENTVFENNTAIFGGAIYQSGAALDVDNCKFYNNSGVGVGSAGTSDTQGGAILVTGSDASADIKGSEFVKNTANLGGAVSFNSETGTFTVDDCTFTENKANKDGGAIFYYGTDATVTVSDSDFIKNDAKRYGGAIFTNSADGSTLNIEESNFKENTAIAATVATFGNSDLSVDECNFTENTDVYGFGVVTSWSTGDLTVENSNFTNVATGAIAVDVEGNAKASVKNTNINTINNYGIWAEKGTLELENNEITAAVFPIVANNAEVVSKVKANVSENKTYNKHLEEITVTVKLTDDNNNLIYDPHFNFVVYKDDEIVFNETGTFDGAIYTGKFTPTEPGTYIVTLDYPVQEVATATYVVVSSLVDLNNTIATATGDKITLDLTMHTMKNMMLVLKMVL